jgi:hypothetical protein
MVISEKGSNKYIYNNIILMKKVIRLTESELIKIVSRIISEDKSDTEVEITGSSQDILNRYEELKKNYEEKYQSLITLYNEILGPLQTEVSQLKSELDYFDKYNIPRIFVMDVEDRSRGVKYLRAVVRYYVEGVKKQQSTTIYLGKASDYPGGVNNPEVKKLAMSKAMDFLAKIKKS